MGVVDGRVRLDLPYEEDSRAEVDANVVATDTGTLIEVQSTGEGATFTRRTLDAMLDVALRGIGELAAAQTRGAGRPAPRTGHRGRARPTRLLVATRNAGKLAELRRMLDAEDVPGWRGLGLADVPEFPEEPETGATFAENALAKARDATKATGLAAVADDSGLAVDALERHAGRALRALGGAARRRPREPRAGARRSSPTSPTTGAARRSCARPRWWCRAARRSWCTASGPAGWPAQPRGTGGFGYDPVFVPDGETRTSAELAPQEKDALSHRGRAMRALLPHLRAAGRRLTPGGAAGRVRRVGTVEG